MNKFNPDVLQKFKNLSANSNKSKNPEFTNDYYKTVTNQPIKTTIKSVNDLKLESDKPDIAKTTSSYESSLRERMNEQISVSKSIEEYNKKNNIKKLEDDKQIIRTRINNNKVLTSAVEVPINTNMIQSTEDNLHLKLKNEFDTFAVLEKDRLKNEKVRYNKLLEDLDSIIKL